MTTFIYADLPYDELVTDAMRNELLPRVKPNWSVLDLGIAGGHAISPLPLQVYRSWAWIQMLPLLNFAKKSSRMLA